MELLFFVAASYSTLLNSVAGVETSLTDEELLYRFSEFTSSPETLSKRLDCELLYLVARLNEGSDFPML
ncbi:hypothetical protein [Candidatus Nitrosocosmicus sp. R]